MLSDNIHCETCALPCFWSDTVIACLLQWLPHLLRSTQQVSQRKTLLAFTKTITLYFTFHLSVEKSLVLHWKKLAPLFFYPVIVPHLASVTCSHLGCLPFTQTIQKSRIECKWEDWFCLPERKFSRKNGISWKVEQNFQTEFPNGECAFHLLVFYYSSWPFGWDRLRSYPPGKSRGNGASPWKFPLGVCRVPFTTTVDQPLSQSKW